MAAVIVGERAHAARHVHDARRAAAFQKRDQLLRQMQRPERIGFERFPHRREIDLQRRRFALGDDARIVDQRVDVAVSVFQKIAEAFDALAIGHVERVKRRRVLASRELLDRRFAGGGLRAVSTTCTPRATSCRQISKPMPRLPPVTTITGSLFVRAIAA